MLMQKVQGIGGVFIVAEDPEMLGAWYQEHLGVPLPPVTYQEREWQTSQGPTVFAFMQKDSEHFMRSNKTWAINFRVDDLDEMIAQLTSAGIEVTRDPEVYPNGIFASLTDPEGNLIQLWEPQNN